MLGAGQPEDHSSPPALEARRAGCLQGPRMKRQLSIARWIFALRLQGVQRGLVVWKVDGLYMCVFFRIYGKVTVPDHNLHLTQRHVWGFRLGQVLHNHARNMGRASRGCRVTFTLPCLGGPACAFGLVRGCRSTNLRTFMGRQLAAI